ncbi:transglutaminase domain-containing protein [Cellulomonas sp. zg-ZUI22]|uniref:transglutaminase family protein n=1 Tax=Cellulomonas sp. zg-ZUI22 TaxID=2816955 RepID=UPI001A9433B4|nr:DUF3488 and transglutaminase-like domain-containing protein [Cellulomonas sp. zg-ZUI22]MBO0900627.1 transglutaminase domain-containing protein [Cellulomonas sp. zg-ZUI22]
MNAGPEQGTRAVVGAALCVVATWAGLLALAGLVAGRRWLVVACVGVLLVAVATTLARAASRRWWPPTLVGALVALVGVVLRYGAPPGRPQFLPDLDAARRAWATARQGVVVVNDSFVPMPDIRPSEMLLVVGGLVVFLLVDAAVLGLRFPAVAGLPLLALWVPAIVLGFPAGAAPVFWTAAAYLALLAYGAAPLHAQAGRARRAATAVVAGVALVGSSVLAGPSLMQLPGWASVALPTFGDGPIGPLELSDDLDLRESLGTRSAQVVLTYRVTDPAAGDPATAADDAAAADAAAAPTADAATGPPADAGTDAETDTGVDALAAPGSPAGQDAGATPSPTPAPPPAVDARLVGPLRAFTMAEFDGRLWNRTEADELAPWDPTTLLSSDPLLRGTAPDAAAGTLARVEIEVGALRERRLPVPTFPRTVAVEGTWGYDPQRDEVVGRRSTGAGLSYQMLVQVPTLTADDLRGTPVGTPPDLDLYTTVPDTQHRDDIATLAADVTADADTAYERALDLQTWLRSASNFTYDTRVPPARSTDAVWDFLEDRRGYCVQFATAMAMMARTLDIPSRIGVGFLPGQRDDDGAYVVTGRLAHAWPELYFDGLGWVRFEPTPASQSGPPPAWADPFTGITAPGSVPDELGRSGQDALPNTLPSAAPATPGAAADEESPWTTVLLLAGMGLLAAGGVLAAYLLSRRRRRATVPDDAWVALRRELSRIDIHWSSSTSPRGVVRHVQRTLETRTGTGLSGPALAALENLALAVERTRYAPTPPVHPADELDGWVQAVRDGLRELLAQGAGRTPVPTG